MSTVEERLTRDIAAVTGGVVVTESDMKDALDGVVDRVEIGRRRSRRRAVVGLAAAAVVIPIVGVAIAQSTSHDGTAPPVGPPTPAPTIRETADQWLIGSPPTQDLVQGLWREDNGHLSIRFSSSGTVQIDEFGRLLGSPEFEGTYEISGDVISIAVDGGAVGCQGARFAMRASLPEPGAMRFVPTASGTGKCTFSQIGVWGTWEQALPAGKTFRGLRFGDELAWQSWPDRDALFGMWAAVGGGYVLEIDGGGSYFVADESGETIDRGRWLYRPSQLTLTSSARSVDCRRGDRALVDHLEYVDPGAGTVAMRWTLKTNTCDGAWAARRWFQIPSVPG
jgi:hypothetical protein